MRQNLAEQDFEKAALARIERGEGTAEHFVTRLERRLHHARSGRREVQNRKAAVVGLAAHAADQAVADELVDGAAGMRLRQADHPAPMRPVLARVNSQLKEGKTKGRG